MVGLDKCNLLRYIISMIVSFAHKGLEDFFHTGSTRGIQAQHANRLHLVLDLLDAATVPEDMNFPGSAFHGLKGKRKHLYVVKISGNWRVVFAFANGNAHVVDYLDYH